MTPNPVRLEVRCAVFRIGAPAGLPDPQLQVLLVPTGVEDRWELPGGPIEGDAELADTALTCLRDQAGAGEVAHLEQLEVFSAPRRIPGGRTVASTYLGLVRPDAPADGAAWHAIDALPDLVADHAEIVTTARHRLAGKLSYTNIAFALAPAEFPMSELSEIYGAALGYPVDTTNLLRILSRRAVITATGGVRRTRGGGRPPALYRFTDSSLRVTDEFATLRPPL
ncbi:MAG: NUDIX hydrolase [Gordonia sp. (in: high G+C Gram-positive bacteria)]|uniref:NUDIX hydrolase n=1 Tax=Gordonia sp. (in: high G+C Gram-positive bacteria) TaxID=84139 RepID=UPI0039E6EDC8